ncbi:hypothetical protein EJ08DRAFT_662052 [Tothia fuscella]|uniref:Uncharacterized protein n=1 Tax=Tothia fuscella TaxID=1048955 RepID=A0A9P4NPM2_9PEZI|nr:hypothetical protein EJ08DRAFT_662052 [Tothia fuscella]
MDTDPTLPVHPPQTTLPTTLPSNIVDYDNAARRFLHLQPYSLSSINPAPSWFKGGTVEGELRWRRECFFRKEEFESKKRERERVGVLEATAAGRERLAMMREREREMLSREGEERRDGRRDGRRAVRDGRRGRFDEPVEKYLTGAAEAQNINTGKWWVTKGRASNQGPMAKSPRDKWC